MAVFELMEAEGEIYRLRAEIDRLRTGLYGISIMDARSSYDAQRMRAAAQRILDNHAPPSPS